MVQSTYDGFLRSRAKEERENLKPAAIPNKSHSKAVFIIPTIKIYVFWYSRQMDRQTDGQMDRQTDREIKPCGAE
jgi:hypothetical protein